MIKKGKHIIKSHMTLEYDFSGIRIQNTVLTPVDWSLHVSLVAGGKKGKSKEDIEINATIAYQKIYFWLDTNLPNILVVDVGNEDDLYLACLSSNIAMFCPDNPHDDLLVQLLHAKISSLAGPNLVVGEIRLRGSDTNLEYTFDEPEDGYELPSISAEYYTEGMTKDTGPWWFRDDGFCFEFVKPFPDEAKEGEEQVKEDFPDIQDPMDEFRKVINDMNTETTVGMVREPARIVQVEKWKPKKI
jgi:hypothetical protein